MPHPDESLLVSGQRLDRYELVCPLAQGGMAEVWVARMQGKRGFEKLVAIKTVLARLSDDPRAQRMFLDEARIIADIHHPNVAGILDLEEDELLYFVLEYVDGDSLAVLRRALQDAGEPFPLPLALRVISDTCLGLHAAHTLVREDGTPAPVVHRDVSPQNVLVSRAGAVKVIDFGIAKMLDGVADETSHGQIKGKVWYMAPEQALLQDVDPRTDVWGAGAVLYHLLAGKPPYPAATEADSYSLLCAGEPPPRLVGVPDVVADIVQRALGYEPRDRFQSAEEMHRALEDAIVETCGAAPTTVVKRAVDEWLGQRLRERRRQIRAAIESLGGAGVWDLSVSSGLDDEAPTHVLGSDEPAVLAPRPSVAPAALSSVPRSSAWIGIALGSAVFAVGIIFVLALRQPSPPPQPLPSPRAPAEPAARAPLAPAAPVVAAGSAPDQQKNATDAAPSATASARPPTPRAAPRPSVPRGGKSPKSPLDVFGEKRK